MPVSHNKAIDGEAPEQGVCWHIRPPLPISASQCHRKWVLLPLLADPSAMPTCGPRPHSRCCLARPHSRTLAPDPRPRTHRCPWPPAAAGTSPIKTVLRSKGFMWIANSHTTAFYWSHAGQHFEIRDEGEWCVAGGGRAGLGVGAMWRCEWRGRGGWEGRWEAGGRRSTLL